MIPRHIHQIWLGVCEIRGDHWEYMKQWKAMYPDFDYTLWTDRDVPEIVPADKQKYFDNWQYTLSMKADILRYEILRKYGGIYIDVDFQPLKRMEEAMLDWKFFGGIQNNGQTANGIIGAEPDTDVMRDVCDKIVANIETKTTQGKARFVDQLTGPEYFTRITEPYKQDPQCVFYKPELFYPYWHTEMHRRTEDFRTTCPEAYAVHHWTKSWS